MIRTPCIIVRLRVRKGMLCLVLPLLWGLVVPDTATLLLV